MKAVIYDDAGEPLAEIRVMPIEVGGSHASESDYWVTYGAEDGPWVDLKQRTLYGFPHRYTPMALLRAALELLNWNEMEREHDPGSPDLERQERGARPALPREASHPVRDY